MRFARLYGQRFRQTGAQVQPRRSGGGVVGQRQVTTQPRIEDFEFNGLGGHDALDSWGGFSVFDPDFAITTGSGDIVIQLLGLIKTR